MTKKIFSLLIIVLAILTLAGCSNNNTTTDTSNSTDTSTTTNTDSVVGDWNYNGTIDNKFYEINLDLEANDRFELEIEREDATTEQDSSLSGTYVYDNDTITLSVITVQDNADSFTGEVIQNSQVELKYTLDKNTLILNNASDLIQFLPAEVTLTRDY